MPFSVDMEVDSEKIKNQSGSKILMYCYTLAYSNAKAEDDLR